MQNFKRNYEMRVRQLNSTIYKLMLVDKGMYDYVVYETHSDTIPSTTVLINKYKRVRKNR